MMDADNICKLRLGHFILQRLYIKKKAPRRYYCIKKG